MSKKKSKNSNYKNDPTVNQTAEDKAKNRMILIVCSVIAILLVGGMIAAMLLSGNGNSDNGDNTPTASPNADPAKTDVMGTGACEHLEKRDIADRDISYVELTFKNYGKIVVLVDATTAPQTAANFLSLVRGGFYNGLTIFRAQENFVIQGGENKSVSLQPITGEFASNGHANDISHIRGVISMARTNDPDSATSQFFITLHDSAAESLDGGYAAFGYVVKGMSVVDEIAEDLLNSPSSGYMGFVGDADAVTIVNAKILEGYTPD